MLEKDVVVTTKYGQMPTFAVCPDGQDKAKPGPVGCVGYCMSGQHITNAAAYYPHRIASAASLYGVGIITDKEDSPHLFLDKIKGELYYAFAETDRSVPPHIPGEL